MISTPTLRRVFWFSLTGLASVAAVFIVGDTLRAVVPLWSPLPWFDEWATVDLIAGWQDGTRTVGNVLFSQHNEHRILVPRLVFFADDLLFRGRGYLSLAAIFAVQLLHAGLFAAVLGRSRPARAGRWAIAAAVLAAMFSLRQDENFSSGFQLQFVAVFAGATLSFVLFGLAAKREVQRRPVRAALLASLGAALITTLTMANGLVVGYVLVVLALIARLRPRVALALRRLRPDADRRLPPGLRGRRPPRQAGGEPPPSAAVPRLHGVLPRQHRRADTSGRGGWARPVRSRRHRMGGHPHPAAGQGRAARCFGDARRHAVRRRHGGHHRRGPPQSGRGSGAVEPVRHRQRHLLGGAADLLVDRATAVAAPSRPPLAADGPPRTRRGRGRGRSARRHAAGGTERRREVPTRRAELPAKRERERFDARPPRSRRGVACRLERRGRAKPRPRPKGRRPVDLRHARLRRDRPPLGGARPPGRALRRADPGRGRRPGARSRRRPGLGRRGRSPAPALDPPRVPGRTPTGGSPVSPPAPSRAPRVVHGEVMPWHPSAPR